MSPPVPSIHLNKLEFTIRQINESIYIQHQPFDYDSSNGVFFKLYPDEEFPLSLGSII